MHITIQATEDIKAFILMLGLGFAFGLGHCLASWLFNALRIRRLDK